MQKKRLFLMMVVGVMVLAGCGSPAATTTTTAPAAATIPATVVVAIEPAMTATTAPANDAFPVTVTDGLGKTVTLDKQPVKIASLTLGTDEILLDMIGPERLIGVSYNAAEANISNIAGRAELAQIKNVLKAEPEQIIALQPDLVLVASWTDQGVVDQLQAAGLKIFAVGDFTSIEAMKKNILTIGKLVGDSRKAEEMTAHMDQQLADIATKLSAAKGEKPHVLHLSTDGWVAGTNTTVDDMIRQAGGINAAASQTDWVQLSAEKIIELNPDVVILSSFVKDEEFLTNPAFATMAAVKNKRVYTFIDAHLSVTSQYIVLGVQDIFKALYPDLAQ